MKSPFRGVPAEVIVDNGTAFKSKAMVPVFISIEGQFLSTGTGDETKLTDQISDSVGQLGVEDARVSVLFGLEHGQSVEDCDQSSEPAAPVAPVSSDSQKLRSSQE